MKLFNFKYISTSLLCVVLIQTAHGNNYLLDDEDSEPFYFDFIYKAPPKPIQRSNFIKDEVLLLYPADKNSEINSITQKYNLNPTSKTVLSSVNTGIVVAKTNGQNPLNLSDKINKKEKSVEAATNNVFKTAITSFKNTYSMYETGVQSVHKITKGKGVSICMVDTPVDIFHPSLSTSFIETLDLFDVNTTDHKSMLHGTTVAGVLISKNPHIGIAPNAKLFAVGAFKPVGKGETNIQGASADIAKAIDSCIQHDVDVINLSFTGGKDSLVEKMIKRAISKDIIVVSAAGNGGNWGSTIYPALIPGVLATTAIDENQKLFKMADKGRFIDYAAPGVNVLTTAPNGKYKLATGTSIASAHVSGVIALLLSQEKDKNIEEALKSTAIDLGKPGRDEEFGEGLINANSALSSFKQ